MPNVVGAVQLKLERKKTLFIFTSIGRGGFSWWEAWGPVAYLVAKVMQARIGYRIMGF